MHKPISRNGPVSLEQSIQNLHCGLQLLDAEALLKDKLWKERLCELNWNASVVSVLKFVKH